MTTSGDDRLILAARAAAGCSLTVITSDRRVRAAAGEDERADGSAAGRHCFEVMYGRTARCENCGLDNAVASGRPTLTARGGGAAPDDPPAVSHVYPMPAEAGADLWCCSEIRAEIQPSKRPDLSVAFLSKLIHCAEDGVIAADRAGRVRIYNEAAARLFGYSAKEALAPMDIRQFYPENGAQETMALLRSERFGGKGRLNGHMTMVRHRSGETIPVRLNASIVYEDERELATIGFFRDMREELRRKREPVIGGPASDAPLAEILEGFTLQMAVYDSRLGAAAVAGGLVTDDQVNQALLKQQDVIEKTKIHIPIGRLLIQMGYLTEAQRDALISAHQTTTAPIEAGGDPPPAKENRAFSVTVSDDGLQAVLRVPAEAADSATPEAVLAHLEAMGIAASATAAADIAAYLAMPAPDETPLVVARGTAPVAGTPPEVALHFDTDPLRSGTEREDGSIDWKDRGSLPQATPGTCLATVTPGTPGTAGTDVRGNPIPAPTPPDTVPRCGKGVALSEDGRIFTAAVQGLVQLSADGVLDVLETLTIAGDIGLDTGHVDFDGHIEVAGTVQEGYRVNGRSMRATDINGAEVTLTGDLLVTGGIYDARVKCGGSVKAGLIHKSQVMAGGDLTTEREIIDSRVETNGKCAAATATIISSEVAARMGVIAADVGTDAAKPCALQVGIDLTRQRQIQNARNKLRLLKKEKDNRAKEWKTVSGRSEAISEELGQKAQQQDKCMVQIREMTAERDALPTAEKAKRKMLEKQILMTEKKKARLDEEVAALLEKDEALSQDVAQMQADMAGLDDDLVQQGAELDALCAGAAEKKGNATVKASGTIAAGTTISGPNAVLIVRDPLSRVLVIETNKPDEDGVSRWRMATKPLR